MYSINIKRIYDGVQEEDGYRVLADRLWPRGISKERAKLDEWAKNIAPSDSLRKQVHQGLLSSEQFNKIYTQELMDNPDFPKWKQSMLDILKQKPITLLTSTKLDDFEHMSAIKDQLLKNTP